VSENVGVGAAGIVQGIGQDGQLAEGAARVDAFGHPHDVAVARPAPGGIDRGGSEWVADHVPEPTCHVALVLG
jgi:hypothetical protein